MRNHGAWSYLQADGVLAAQLDMMIFYPNGDDFNANKRNPLKGMCYRDDFKGAPVPSDSDERHNCSIDEDSDIIMNEDDDSISRSKDPRKTIVLEEIDPTWVYKALSEHFFTCKKPGAAHHVDRHKVPDTAARRSEDGDLLFWSDTIEVSDDDTHIDETSMLKELSHNCRFLYEVGKRPNVGVHMLAACAYIKKHRMDNLSIGSELTLCIKNLFWYSKGKWVAQAYCRPEDVAAYPGISSVYNYCCDGTGFSPEVSKAIESVIHICSMLNIDMRENDGSHWLEKGGKYKSGCAGYYFEKFNEYGDVQLPKLMREVFVSNATMRNEMFHILRNMCNEEVSIVPRTKTPMDTAYTTASLFNEQFPFLEIVGNRYKDLNNYSMSDDDVLKTITTTWFILIRNKFKPFTDYVSLLIDSAMLDSYSFVNGILCLCIGTCTIPAYISIGETKYLIVTGGYLLPICTVVGSRPITIDYSKPFTIYSVKTIVDAASLCKNISEEAKITVRMGGD